MSDAETSFSFDVFLSHSSKDKAIVRPLAERLRADGLRVWFDEWEIKPGDSIPARIEEGLEQSRVLALCMSANAFGSDWAKLEAGTFRFRDPLNKERRFIPLRLDDAPIKSSLTQFLYISWHPANRPQEYAKLLQACNPAASGLTDLPQTTMNSDDEPLTEPESVFYSFIRASTKRQDDAGITGYAQSTVEDLLATCNRMIHCLAGFDTVFLMSPDAAAEQARQIDGGWLRDFNYSHEILCLAAAARKIKVEPYRQLASSAYAFWKGTARPRDTEANLKRFFTPGIGALHNLKRALMLEVGAKGSAPTNELSLEGVNVRGGDGGAGDGGTARVKGAPGQAVRMTGGSIVGGNGGSSGGKGGDAVLEGGNGAVQSGWALPPTSDREYQEYPMLVLHHAGGAGDFSIIGTASPNHFSQLRYNVLRVLRARGQDSAASVLESIPFKLLEATNHFNDEFSVLHASVSLPHYEQFRVRHDDPEVRTSCRRIADVFQELGQYVRFIAVDLQLESEPAGVKPALPDKSGWRLSRLEITKLVKLYIGVQDGYLGDFSRRSLHDFYLELNLDIDPKDYEGTTRERFIKILSESAPEVQARILEGIISRYPTGSSQLRTQDRYSEIGSWIARLREAIGPAPVLVPGQSAGGISGADQAAPNFSGGSDTSTVRATTGRFRFEFGISFAGSDRDLARQLRNALKAAGFSVFFDEDFEHEMIGHDGSVYLRNIYSRECRFCIVLISRAYDERDWTNLERETVQARELRGERGILIPVPIEDYQPSWLPETRIRFDLWKRSIPELVRLLTKRCTGA